jgi:hypothetical protein
MLQSMAVLMFFQFLGELLVQATGLHLPGPVCGGAHAVDRGARQAGRGRSRHRHHGRIDPWRTP